MLLWKVVLPIVLLSALATVPLDDRPAEVPVAASSAEVAGMPDDTPGAAAEVPFRFEAAARDPFLNISTHVGDDPTFEIAGRPVNMLVEIAWDCLGFCPLRIALLDDVGQAVDYLEGESPQSVYVAAPEPGTWKVDLSTVQAGVGYEGLVRVTTAVEDGAGSA